MNEECERQENTAYIIFNCSSAKELSAWKLQSLWLSGLQEQLGIVLGVRSMWNGDVVEPQAMLIGCQEFRKNLAFRFSLLCSTSIKLTCSFQSSDFAYQGTCHEFGCTCLTDGGSGVHCLVCSPILRWHQKGSISWPSDQAPDFHYSGLD